MTTEVIPGTHWPGFDADDLDDSFVFVPSSEGSSSLTSDQANAILEAEREEREKAATLIQAAARDRAARLARPRDPVTPPVRSSSRSPATQSLGVLLFAVAAFAGKIAHHFTPSEKMPGAALLAAPVAHTSVAATPALLGGPSAPPLPAWSTALMRSTFTSPSQGSALMPLEGSASTEPRDRAVEIVTTVLVVGAFLAIVYATWLLGKHAIRGVLSACTPRTVTPPPSSPVVSPPSPPSRPVSPATVTTPLTPTTTTMKPNPTATTTMKPSNPWNEFQQRLKGLSLSPTERSRIYTEYKKCLEARDPINRIKTIEAREKAIDVDDSIAHGLVPRNLNLELNAMVDAKAVGAKAVGAEEAVGTPLTWNGLQKACGGRGFTKQQMSLMWAAHKSQVQTYQAFRTHVKGQGYTRAIESAMWKQHKLFGVRGVHVKCVRA